jgi:ribonuclease HI
MAVFVDGACPGNGKQWAKGGYGVYFGRNSIYNVSASLPHWESQTSQRAELSAALCAVKRFESALLRYSAIESLIIVTDSAYLVNSITNYIMRWKVNGWKTSLGNDVANTDLWIQLDYYCWHMLFNRGVNVSFWKIDRSDNQEADDMAKMGVFEK